MIRSLLRRAAALLAAVTLALSCGGCAGGQQPLQVTLVLKTTVETAEFWGEVMDGVQAAVEEFDVSLTVTGASAETEVDEQIAIVQQVITEKPDVMILVASDYDRLVPVTEQAVEQGIPVVTMDSDVNTALRSCYVGSDNEKIGRNQGRLMRELLPRGKVAILTHSDTASSGTDRAKGAMEALSENPDIEVLGIYNSRNDMDTAQALVAQLLEEHPDLAGFVCSNEVCNLATGAYLAQQGLDGQVLVIGCDNSTQQIQFLEQNAIQGIVIQRPFRMGYMAVQTAVEVAGNATVEPFLEIPCVSITYDNMYKSENQKLLFPF